MDNLLLYPLPTYILVGVVFNLLNRICRLKKKIIIFCARDPYSKSLTATSSIRCKQIIKTVVLSEKRILNHVARDDETS